MGGGRRVGLLRRVIPKQDEPSHSRWESETVQPLRATARPCSERSRRAPPRPACRRVSRTNSNAGPRDARPLASTDALFVTAQTRRRPQVHHVLSGRMECGLSLQSDIDPSAGRRDQPPRRPCRGAESGKTQTQRRPRRVAACGGVHSPRAPPPKAGGGAAACLRLGGWWMESRS